MKFEETFDFDFDADTVLRMFGDKDYYVAKYVRLGGQTPEIIDSEKTDSQFTIVVRHALDASKLSFPEILKKRIGDHLMLRQTDRWQTGSGSGRIDIDIEKAPVDISIALQIADRNGGSRLTLVFDIDAQVPLLGGKIEKAIAGPITRHMHKDLALSNRMAADYAG